MLLILVCTSSLNHVTRTSCLSSLSPPEAPSTQTSGLPKANTSIAISCPCGGKSGGKAATKEKFIKFFDLLEEVAERHWIARVLEDDEEWRKTIVDGVVRLVVPNLQQFTTKNKEKEFSKSGYLFSSFYVLLH